MCWLIALIVLLVSAAVGVTYWCTHQQFRRSLDELGKHLARIRENPSSANVQKLSPLLGPVYFQAAALASSYRNALSELSSHHDPHETPRITPIHEGGAGEGRRLGQNSVVINRRLVARLSPDLRWLLASPALQTYLGRSFDKLQECSFLDLVHGEDAPVVFRHFSEVIRDGEGHNIVFRLLRSDIESGKERHVQMDVLTRYDEKGRPLHLRCHFLDITDKMRTERELRQRTEELSAVNESLQRTNRDLEQLKESYRDLYHHAPIMYFSLDETGNLASYNDTMSQVLGYERDELLHRPYERLLDEKGRKAFQSDPTIFQRAGEVETRWIKRNGLEIVVWIKNTPVLEENGKFLRSRSAASDVTERTRLGDALRVKAEELEKANQQLRKINRELDDFTYVVSHDLKEPLRTLEAFSNFLVMDYGPRLEGEGIDYLNHLVEASKRLGSLIDDLLILSRAGSVLNAPRAFDLNEVVQTVLPDLRDLIQRKEARIRVEGVLPPVAGDPKRVAQLLANLIGNGLKYNHSMPPEVIVGQKITPNSSDFATLFIRDNGIGIEPKYHEQIFRIFKRLHRREEYEGTGAGLAICKKVVEAHHGTIWVESQPNQGATFYFTLPRTLAALRYARGERDAGLGTDDSDSSRNGVAGV